MSYSKRKYTSVAYPSSSSTKYARSYDNGTVIRHREYITDIVSGTSGAFDMGQVLPINPAYPTTFPWLSKTAAAFQEYRFSSLQFEYISTSADALGATNVNLGAVVVAVDYNATNPPFAAKSQMENSETSISGKPSGNLYMPVEVTRRSGQPLTNMFCRSSVQPANTDLRFYDLGQLEVATQGTQASGSNFVLGELWVEYVVHLYKPLLTSQLIPSSAALVHYSNSTYTFAAPLYGSSGAATSKFSINTIGATVNNTTVQFPAGAFSPGNIICIQFVWIGSTNTNPVAPSITMIGLTAALALGRTGANPTGSDSLVSTFAGGPTNVKMCGFTQYCTVVNPAVSSSIGIGTLGTLITNATSVDVYVSVLPINAE